MSKPQEQTQTQTQTQTHYNKLFGSIRDEYYFCNDIFDDGEVKSVTGTVLIPIDRDWYTHMTEGDGLLEQLEESWRIAVENGDTQDSLEDWARDVYNDEGDEAVFDLSAHDLWDQLREIGLDEETYPVFAFNGWGKCFSPDMEFDDVYDPELLKTIIEIVTK